MMICRKIEEFLKKKTANKSNRFIYLLACLLIHLFIYSSTYLFISHYFIYILHACYFNLFILLFAYFYFISFVLFYFNLLVLIDKLKINCIFIIRASFVNCNLTSRFLFLSEKCCWVTFTKHLWPCEKSKIERFAKEFNDWNLFT